MNLGVHAGFIVAAYLAAAVVVALLIVWVVADYRAQRRALAELESTIDSRKPAGPLS